MERKRNSFAAGCGSGRLANICEIELQDKVNIVFQMLYYIGYFYNSKGEEMWKEPWYFAKAEDTERILNEISFSNIEVFLEKKLLIS